MKDDPMDITDMKDMNTAKLREVIAHEESGDALIEWAADEIERLHGIEDAAKIAAGSYEAEITRLRAENERMRAALEAVQRDGLMAAKQVNAALACSVCHGTGMRPVEYGPAGATWTDYERCFACKGVGTFTRRTGDK